jgi:hypothetical protein
VRELDEENVNGYQPRLASDAEPKHPVEKTSWSGERGMSRPLGGGQVLALQRAAGNAAVSRLLADDEQESDAGASVQDVVGKGGGQPLPDTMRSTMESSFGQDFSSVRLHTDGAAASSAREMNAKAYTVGDDIVLGASSPSLHSSAGQHTLAHELTHVVQQRSGPVDGTDVGGGVKVSDPSDRFENQAESVAAEVASGGAEAAAPVQREQEGEGAEELTLQRAVAGDEEEEEEEPE